MDQGRESHDFLLGAVRHTSQAEHSAHENQIIQLTLYSLGHAELQL